MQMRWQAGDGIGLDVSRVHLDPADRVDRMADTRRDPQGVIGRHHPPSGGSRDGDHAGDGMQQLRSAVLMFHDVLIPLEAMRESHCRGVGSLHDGAVIGPPVGILR